jgi:hypothetical protein
MLMKVVGEIQNPPSLLKKEAFNPQQTAQNLIFEK